MRKRFANLFSDMLRTQLILKNIVAPEDWDSISDHIHYDFLYDNQFAELKETELLNERLGILATMEPYIGRFYSAEFARKKVLRQTEQEIIEIDQQIKREIEDGTIPDPAMVDPVTGEPLGMEGDPNTMGELPPEPEVAPTQKQMGADIKKAEI